MTCTCAYVPCGLHSTPTCRQVRTHTSTLTFKVWPIKIINSLLDLFCLYFFKSGQVLTYEGSIAKFLLLDVESLKGGNIQTVLIPLAGKRDGLFPEQSLTSEYKNKHTERARAKPRNVEGGE